MKKLLAIFLAFSLVACAELQVIPDLLANRPNPVTKEHLYEVENALVIAVSGLNVYKKLCIRKVIEQTCREKVEDLQVYTRQAKPVLVNLRKFVKENDQVNAVVAYKTIKQITEDLKRETPVVGES